MKGKVLKMISKSIAVVILHYNNFIMTKNYIENLRRLNWHKINHKFIIVDNASPDNSGVLLKEAYQQMDDIEVLLLEKNLGFAKGNNVGILYARDVLKFELVVVSNNDIEIKTSTFPRQLLEMYEESCFAVYGPDIYSLNKKIHQNPFREKPLNKEEVLKEIKKIDKLLPLLKLIDKLKIYNFLSKVKSLLFRKKEIFSKYTEEPKINFVLHGAFFVLSEKYFEKYPDGLYDGTFLYMEEDILAYRCQKKNLKMLYDPKLAVIHFDGVSSLREAGDRCKKYIRELTEIRKSCINYINYMDNLNDDLSIERK